jgi:hypothetical protein
MGEDSNSIMHEMDCQALLFEMVCTLAAPRSFPGRLDGRQQQSDQNADDGNHYEELYQCKCSLP